MSGAWAGLNPPYATLVVDPPWRYNTTTGLTTNGRKPSTAEGHYSTMTMAEISALPVVDLVADKAHLYLWVTNSLLFGDSRSDGVTLVDIVRTWGFHYVTMLTWVKTGQIGMGWHFRGATEHALFATRGRCPLLPGKPVSNVVTSPRGRHSQKPGAFYDLVERVSPGPYVELFARQPRLGWDSWGHGYEHLGTAEVGR